MQARRFLSLRASDTAAIALVAVVVWAAPGAALTSTFGEPAALETFTSAGHVVGFSETGYFVSNGTYALRVEFDGAKAVAPVAEGQVPEPAAVTGKAAPAAPLGKVTYAGLWAGIDGTYDAEGGILRSTWTVAPGADPGKIRLKYNVPVEITAQGELGLRFETGALTESPPIAWQDIDGERQPVEVAFVEYVDNQIGFTLGEYLPDLPLTIDPTLTWNTFLGGSAESGGHGIAVDGGGNVFIAGASSATWGRPVRFHSGSEDAFVARLDSSGNLIWNTFLGGSDWDWSDGIALDASGNVFVSGSTRTTWGSPVRPYSGSQDAFVACLDANGNLIWHTFFGGNSSDGGTGIAVDNDGSVLVTGWSTASWGSPVRPYSGSQSAFVARIDSSGSLIWNTFLGSGEYDEGNGIAVDSSGNVFITGRSDATWGSPVRVHSGLGDAFVARVNISGNVVWNTFLGGSSWDWGHAVAVNGNGSVFVAGSSRATWGGPVRPYSGMGSQEVFVAHLDAAGNLAWNTFLGSGGWDASRGIAVDGDGDAFVTGWSDGNWGRPERPHSGLGSDDVLVVRLDPSGNITWNSFLGGSSADYGGGIALDSSGNVLLTGTSYGAWGRQVLLPGETKAAFVAKLPAEHAGEPTASATKTSVSTPTQTPTLPLTPIPTPTLGSTLSPTLAPQTATPAPSPEPTAPPLLTPTTTPEFATTPTPSPSKVPTQVDLTCAGDCNGDGRVTVDEIVRAVAIALGNVPASECPAADRNGDGRVTVDELVRAVAMALGGCSQE